ncbi:B-box zinc finger protein (macronuclear) [Tetrahymena thermophila SB210]|uniref:B-box zinc finger protein n=1 Tax=Tetrahymena thermophila (strain SB210) TaxID=312017 RepID=I7M1L5_TETTS|nr:B-box zinc finger protein [Tetrahymena thermophila SB210]EAR97126.1 B-box zinc finger protein [Tetrahymena thermophila SB210]|eukprot:XP_001017371.1 B-box zinc finger protein [Tetrahymena thermophila SB210]
MIRSNGTYNNGLNNRNFAQMLEEINFNLQSFPLTSVNNTNNSTNIASNLNTNTSSSNQNNGHVNSNLSSNPQPSSIVGHSNSNLIQAQFLHSESSSQQNQAGPSYHIRYQQPSSISSRYDNNSYQRYSNNAQVSNESSSTNNTRKKQNSSPKIQDILTCLICFGKLKNAHMCPDCQKMCCESCIKQWLSSKSHCPHCRSHLRPSNLMKCRFVNEITTALEKIEQIEQKKEKQGICEEHDNPLLYYCQICKHPVCSDCGMIGSQHKNHRFDKLNSVYETHVKQVRQELSAVKKKLQELNKQQQEVDVVIEKITKMRDDKAASLTQQMDYVNIKLNDLLKSKLEKLSLQRGPISEEIDLLENMSEEINEYIETLPKSILISKSGEIVKTLEEINSRRVIKNFIGDNEKKLEFQYDMIPPYDSADYFLQNYSVKRKSADVSYSETLYAHGNEWRLKVYLNGKDKAKDSFLSVFVEMTKGSVKPSNFEYRVEMINQVNPDLRVTREFISPFETGATWGYEKFFKLSQLESEGYLLPESDMLIFKYYVRSPSYSQFCQSKQNRIEELEAKNLLLQEEIKQLKENQSHNQRQISNDDISQLQVSEQLKFEGINESKADNFELETFINEVENGSISNIRSQLENYLKQKALEEFAKSDTEGEQYEANQNNYNHHEDAREGDDENQEDEDDDEEEEEDENDDHEQNDDEQEEEDDHDGSSDGEQEKFESQNYIENLKDHQDEDSLYDNEVDEYQYKRSNNNGNNQNKEFMEKIIQGEHKASLDDYDNDDELENNQSEPMEYDSFIDELAAKKLKRKQELEFIEQQNLKEELELNSIAKDIQDILKQENTKSQYNFKTEGQSDKNKRNEDQDEIDLYCKMEEEIQFNEYSNNLQQLGSKQNNQLNDNQLQKSFQFRDQEISAILQGSKLTDRAVSQNEDKQNLVQSEQNMQPSIQQQTKDNDYRLRWNGIMQNVSQALKSGDSANVNQSQQLTVNPYSLKTNLLQQNRKEMIQQDEDNKNDLHLLEESKICNENDDKLAKSTQESDFPDIYMMLDDIGDKVHFIPVSQHESMNESSIMIKKNLLPEFEQEALRIEEKKLEVQQHQLQQQQQKMRNLISGNSAASTPTQIQNITPNLKSEKINENQSIASTKSKYYNCEEQAFQSVKNNSYQPTFSQYQQQQEQAKQGLSSNLFKDKNIHHFDSFIQRYESQFKSETTHNTQRSDVTKNEGINNLKSDRLYTYQVNTNKGEGKEPISFETQQFKYNFKKNDGEQSQAQSHNLNENRGLNNSISVQSLQASQNSQNNLQAASKKEDVSNLLGQFTNPTLSKLVASHSQQKEQEESNKPSLNKNSTTPINSLLQNNFTSSTANYVNKKNQSKIDKSEAANDDQDLEINDLLEKENKDDSLLAMERQIQKLEMMNKLEEETKGKSTLTQQRVLQSKDQTQLKQQSSNSNSQQNYSEARKQLISSINFSEDFLKKINKVKQYGNLTCTAQGENSTKNKQLQNKQDGSSLQSSSSLAGENTNNQQIEKSQQKNSGLTQEQAINTYLQPNQQCQQENKQQNSQNLNVSLPITKNQSPESESSDIKLQEEEIKKLESLVVEQSQEK